MIQELRAISVDYNEDFSNSGEISHNLYTVALENPAPEAQRALTVLVLRTLAKINFYADSNFVLMVARVMRARPDIVSQDIFSLFLPATFSANGFVDFNEFFKNARILFHCLINSFQI